MPTSKKIFTVQNLTEKVRQAKGLILSDYQGLNMTQLAQLRGEIKNCGGEFEVVKNNLLKLAVKDGLSGEFPESETLTGPTAALWIYKEDLAPLKALDQFIEKNDLPKVKSAFWDGETISPEKVKELARLPDLDQLRAKLVGALQSPTWRLVYALGWNLKKLVYILKSKGGES